MNQTCRMMWRLFTFYSVKWAIYRIYVIMVKYGKMNMILVDFITFKDYKLFFVHYRIIVYIN